jgi:hypothetical protein
VADVPRASLHSHPWSIGGGGAAELKELIDDCSEATAEQICANIGFMAIAGDEDVYFADRASDWQRRGLQLNVVREMVDGLAVRDWAVSVATWCVFDYDHDLRLSLKDSLEPHFWVYRTLLSNALYFGKTKAQRHLDWRGWAVLVKASFASPENILFATVATHNHFYLERGSRIGGSTVQVIAPVKDMTRDDLLGLLSVLNSSVAGFWLRQVCHDKGGGGIGGGIAAEAWERFFAFNATKVAAFPVPATASLRAPGRIQSLVDAQATLAPAELIRRLPCGPRSSGPSKKRPRRGTPTAA